MVHYHANDTAQALVHQKKMVIINERVHGLDHHDTAHSYVRSLPASIPQYPPPPTTAVTNVGGDLLSQERCELFWWF